MVLEGALGPKAALATFKQEMSPSLFSELERELDEKVRHRNPYNASQIFV
jgi:hypothetical protein